MSVKMKYSNAPVDTEAIINIDKSGCHLVQKSLNKGNIQKRIASLFKHSKNVPQKKTENNSIHTDSILNNNSYGDSWRS